MSTTIELTKPTVDTGSPSVDRLPGIDLFDDKRLLDNPLKLALFREGGKEVFQYIASHIDLNNFKNILFSTEKKSYIENLDFNNIRVIVDFKRINHLKNINRHLRSMHTLLPDAGIYIGCVETYGLKKARIMQQFGKRLGKVAWAADFVFNRVMPRVEGLDHLYYFITKGKYHTVSLAESLGRTVYCGFDVIEYKFIGNLMYFVVIKTKEPSNDPKPSFNPLIRLRRVGKNGKMIGVYKFRTMHPYSEYLQDFVLRLNGYDDKGKPANDFRVTQWGKMIRKVWVDELPQLLNVLKGEMKLVGVRPLSRVRFSQFPEDMQAERIKYKPGCFPPYVALNMPNDSDNIEAERIYLADLKKHPHTTDMRYLLKAVYNIVTNKIRSA